MALGTAGYAGQDEGQGRRGVILVFAAMRPEVDACLGWAPPDSETDAGGFPILVRGDVVVCQTGIGRRARGAAAAALDRYSPTVVLSAGIAGGLAAGIAVGDVVVCPRIDHESHRSLDVDATVYSEEALVREAVVLAQELGLPVREGASLTVDEIAWTAAEKAAHHAWKGHAIVEMESYWIGEAAVGAGVPFLTVRTISDAAVDEILQFDAMIVREDGTFDQEAYLSHLRDHPETATYLATQAERTRLALGNLSKVMTALVPRLVSGASSQSTK